jgi:NADPH:quinone reductase-like Zn-dependent oxidoreductase
MFGMRFLYYCLDKWHLHFDTRGQEKAQLLKDLGADYVVDPSDGGLIKSVQAFLKSKNLKGVDVLYDPVGGKLFKDSMKLLKWGAHILIIGFTSGEIPTIRANIILVKVRL